MLSYFPHLSGLIFHPGTGNIPLRAAHSPIEAGEAGCSHAPERGGTLPGLRDELAPCPAQALNAYCWSTSAETLCVLDHLHNLFNNPTRQGQSPYLRVN